MRPNHTVFRYRDGRTLKGYTYNLNPNKHHFHLFPVGDAGAKGTEVWLRDVKAVFFTRDPAGNPEYQESKEFDVDQPFGYRRIRVTFSDGEVLYGHTTRYDAGNHGFYFVPADPKSNNLRIFAVLAAVRDVGYVDADNPGRRPPDPGDGRLIGVSGGPEGEAAR